MYLLDTNILSEIVKRAPNARVMTRLQEHSPMDLFASEISRYELRYGAASKAQGGTELWQKVERLVVPAVTWLAVTQGISEAGGNAAAALRRAGRPAGELDPLIAATALVHRLTLVTRNVEHFAGIPDIRIENWFESD